MEISLRKVELIKRMKWKRRNGDGDRPLREREEDGDRVVAI